MAGIRVMHVVRPSDGGIKNHILTLIGRSSREVFHHMVACPPGVTADAFSGRGIPTFLLPLKDGISLSSDMTAVKNLAYHFRENRVDIAHCHGFKAGLVGRLAALLAGVPAVVMTLHNSIVFSSRGSLWKNTIYTKGERILSCLTDRYIAVSGDLAGEITARSRVSPGKVTVIYNGINGYHFGFPPDRRYLERTTGIPAGHKVVGTVARLAPQKAVGDFIKAASILSRLEGVSFLVVGDGPLREELERESRELSLSGRLFFAGERRDVDRIMPCLDVFVLTSLSEGLPLALLEAMGSGCPVVATRVGGVPEVVSDGVSGLLLEPGDVPGIARSIEMLICNREKSRQMGTEGKKMLAESFTAGKMASAIERVYTDLVNRGCMPSGRKLKS
ncbi:MAG: glycosyltransferase family 4 protein [Bacillota bacterium]